jgi:uncharacterized membrane protein
MIEVLFPGLAALQNIHPVFVHFPIAFFTGALAMEALAVLRDERFHPVATWLLYLGALSAVVTVLTGADAANRLAAAEALGHNAPGHEQIHVHRNWMVGATVMSVALALYLGWVNRTARWAAHRWGVLLGLALLSVVVSLGADRGARLVYEFGVGVNPQLFREAAPDVEHQH